MRWRDEARLNPKRRTRDEEEDEYTRTRVEAAEAFEGSLQ